MTANYVNNLIHCPMLPVGAFHSFLIPFTHLQHRTARVARYSIPQGYIPYRTTLAFCHRSIPNHSKFYSEYHYLEDEIYHSGTGLLGQPSLIYATKVNRFDNSSYYLMNLMGHGHHSARDGQIYPDLVKITTAKKIVERILVKINW